MVRSDASQRRVAGWRRALLAAALVALAAPGLLLSSCAAPGAADDGHTDKEYRTGSNIPVRDRNAQSDAKTYDPNSVQDAVRATPPRPPVGLKGG